MQLKSIIMVAALSLSMAACSLDKVVYRIDVPQGNYLKSDAVKQLKVGMNAEQVQYLLGTPVLHNPYEVTRWYYVFLQQKAYEKAEQYTLVVNFDNTGVVTGFDLDKPLPDSLAPVVNNEIISHQDIPSKPWWKFWK
ncbi:outer membrane protein assembly factor BamE [[Haemophilus] felis]|uniref:Outer membrane protein assembly factor BamE n=1 Tax=[Haemophilus] felis TaxID=123822 RepID=A0A1T0BCM5_9PAST|nr:outer membrane protein assembly factor BamE [[Haemophilus] felis]NBI41176.1 outer membrane protein assembly factor BamE [[Haemophilus] felis]NBI42801.1 outer membrane protein assembly factor BamE [[Haemophilus] felis]OOS07521.1 outer membrane protein assembly factor BamE [[Haemophilus] felis]